MKVVLAPDSFKESMSASAAAAAMARGVRRVLPDAECVEVPMADGGEGTTDALVAALGGDLRRVAVRNALGRTVEATYGWTPDGLAVIEVAAAVGLGLIGPSQRDILRSTSSGVADLLTDALDAGATRFILGLGGSATNDGGAGLLTGLGAVLLDDAGEPVPPAPAELGRVARVDLSSLDPRVSRVTIELACDVTNPLLGEHGASAVFGPQKGATPEQVPVLDAALARLADALALACGHDVRELPGAGAAGGLGAAFLSLGARMRRGVEVVVEASGLEQHIRGADLVITAEGSMDFQTLSGKTPAGVAEAAARHGVPTIGLAGRLGQGAEDLIDHGFAAVVPIVRGPVDLPTALRTGPENLELATATVLRLVVLGRHVQPG
jgi:glycerate kinase